MGKVFLALPILPSLMSKEAFAQAQQDIRMLALSMPHGGHREDDIYPNYLPNNKVQMVQGHDFHHSPLRLSDGLNAISKIYSSGLNPFINKLNLIQGLDKPHGNNHSDFTFLGQFFQLRKQWSGAPFRDQQSGMPNVASIDQFLAHHPKIYNTAPTVRYISNTIASRRFIDPNDYSKGVTTATITSGPQATWDRLFGIGTPPTDGTVDPAALEKAQNSKTLVDQVLGDLNKVKTRRDISSEDVIKVEAIAQEMHELQQKLQDPQTAAICAKPPEPGDVAASGTDSERAQYWDLYTSVLAAGIKCGRTKISHISTGTGTARASSGANWHDWTHNDPENASYNIKDAVTETESWIVEKILVPLLTKLDVEESNGNTFLDNSIVVFGNVNSSAHNPNHIPILLAGSAGGFFSTGNYVDYRRREYSSSYGSGFQQRIHGLLYNQLLVSIMMSMGLSENDFNIINGVRGYAGTRPISEGADSRVKIPRTDIIAHSHVENLAGTPLPIITNAG